MTYTTMSISSLYSLHTSPTTTLLRPHSLSFPRHRSLSICSLDIAQSLERQPKVINSFMINCVPKIYQVGSCIGATQSHHSVWFSQPKDYSQGLEEDKKIRDFIKAYAEKRKKKHNDIVGIARIVIQKKIDLIQVIIHMLSPGLLTGNRPRGIDELRTKLQKELNCVNRKVIIAVTRIASPNANPNILSEFIAKQLLENEVSGRKVMKKTIELAGKEHIKGIQIQIKGRIDGKEIARVEWVRESRVPLQTIRAKIDYCALMVKTKYGVLGIKIWIFRDEEQKTFLGFS